MSSLSRESARLKQMEDEIRQLREAIANTRQDIGLEEVTPELKAAIDDNVKLRHRLSILKRAIAQEQKMADGNASGNQCPASTLLSSDSIVEHLLQVFGTAIERAYPGVSVGAIVTLSNVPKFGDYQCNSAMPIVQQLKSQGLKANPREVAQKIMEAIPSNDPMIAKVEVAGAGFVNVHLNKVYVAERISTLLKTSVKAPEFRKQRVIVDFSSPNVAKEMHVGHLRSTIIGDSICRLLEFFGHDVLRLNHIGDWGTQFGMLIAHLCDRFPNFQEVSPPISDLQAFYKESKVRFDEDEEFKKRAYACVVKLQRGEDSYKKAWSLICDVSRKEFQKIYDRLEIQLIERGESFYQSRMEAIVEELKQGGFLEQDDGRLIMWGDNGKVGIPLTVVKSDGGFTYDTSDMAAIKQRLHEERGDWLVYVTDAGQEMHFSTIFSCAKRAKILDPSKHRVDHVGFGVVLGEDGKKFKTRSGDTVKLINLLDEGLKRSMDKLVEKERDKVLTPDELKAAQISVAYGCIKYADLQHNRTNEYVFSFDKMLEDKGNTAVYLLYAYTRIRSIARNCGGDYANNLDQVINNTTLLLAHEKEWKLAKVLLKFTDIMIQISKTLCLHYLCDFVYEVSTTFSEFYDSCYCIEKDSDGNIIKVNAERVLLCEATSRILAKCFDILGLKPLHKI